MHLRSTVSRAATLLGRNPQLFCKVAIGKLKTARPLRRTPFRQNINGVVFEYDLPDYHAAAPMHFGTYAPLVVNAMKRFIRPGTAVIDVGANIGYLSAVAAGLVGPQGQVHAFEPVPAYFERLRRLAISNPRYSIVANATAVGDVTGPAAIHVAHEVGQSTMVPGYLPSKEGLPLSVPVVRLDEYIESKQIRNISLIKIDAEGFEFPVLRGLERYFASQRERTAIVCEIAPRAYALRKTSLSTLAEYMETYGYSAYDLADAHTPVDIRRIRNVDDVLFLTEASH